MQLFILNFTFDELIHIFNGEDHDSVFAWLRFEDNVTGIGGIDMIKLIEWIEMIENVER